MNGWAGAGVGAVAAGAVIVFEVRVRALSLKRLIGAMAGSVLGIAGAALFCMVLRGALPSGSSLSVIQIFVLLLMTYVGLLVGASKGDLLNPAALGMVCLLYTSLLECTCFQQTFIVASRRLSSIWRIFIGFYRISRCRFASCSLFPSSSILRSLGFH